MGDSNTWDLVGEQQQRKKSRSPSRASRVDSEVRIVSNIQMCELTFLKRVLYETQKFHERLI